MVGWGGTVVWFKPPGVRSSQHNVLQGVPTRTSLQDRTLINPRPGRGGDATPLSFLRCTSNYEADRAEILRSLWGIRCATFEKKIWPGHVRSRSYDVIRGTASGRIFTKCVPSPEVFCWCYPHCLMDRHETSHACWGKYWPSCGARNLTGGQLHQKIAAGCDYFLIK